MSDYEFWDIIYRALMNIARTIKKKYPDESK